MDTNRYPPVQEQATPVLSVIVLCYRQGESSWRAAKISKKQLVLYSTRRWPRLSRAVYTRLRQVTGRQRVHA